MAGGQQQGSLFAGEVCGQAGASQALYTQSLPLAQGLADGELSLGVVEARGQADFEAPGLTGDPAGSLQVIGGRGQGVAGEPQISRLPSLSKSTAYWL